MATAGQDAQANADADASARSPEQTGADHAGKPGRSARWPLAIAAVVAVVVVGLIAFSVGRLSTLVDPDPVTTSAEAGFARDMQAHHIQGVEMAMMILDRTDDPQVSLLAFDIATTQGQQSGQMYGWLELWGLSQAGSEPSMTWMTRPGASGSSHHSTSGADASAHVPGEPMPGMATPEQIAELNAASGAEAERIFLTLMIAHHQGALEMAEALLDRSTHTVVTTFADSVMASQASEIELMQKLLAERTP